MGAVHEVQITSKWTAFFLVTKVPAYPIFIDTIFKQPYTWLQVME